MVFYLAFCKSIDFGSETHCSLQGGLVVVFSLGSSPTVDTANRAKRLQPNLNTSGSGSGFRFNGIYGTPNKTQQKLYFALPYLMKQKKMRMSALPWESADSKLSPGKADILNLKL